MKEVQSRGLTKARDIYQNRDKRAKELKQGGRKIMAYLCCYPPVELVTAANLVPYRVLGDMSEPLTIAESYLPPIMCNFIRSAFDIYMKGRYDFIDGYIGAHACDGAERVSRIWRYHLKAPYSFFLDVPHTAHKSAFPYFKVQLNYLKSSLEAFIGREILQESLKQAVSLHNESRALVRQLYELRKPDPPLISGTEVLQVIVALMSIPVEEGNELLREVIQEVKERTEIPQKKRARLIVWGCLIDNVSLMGLIEDSGANVVIDDTALGTRPFWRDVELTNDPLDGLASHYLDKILCPRTFRETGKTYKEDLENRFGYLKGMIKQWNANGAVLSIIRNCDAHGYELPAIEDYFQWMEIPALAIEHDYTIGALEPLRTRFQAFIEMIGSR